MKILVINAGSSSIKYQLIDMQDEKLLAKGLVERIGEVAASRLVHKANGTETEFKQSLKDHAEGMELVLKTLVDEKVGVISSLSEISAIGHRVLHGGEKYKTAVLVDDEVKKDMEENVPLGPLHMPANMLGIAACEKVMPHCKNVAVFDTAFHGTMPDYAYMYAVPYDWYKNYRIRKYGFHGTSHEFIANEIARVMNKDVKDLRVISCHLGNGASLCAVNKGKCVDTSMGFTPLEGLVMGTRSGDIDPAVVEYVMDKMGKNVHEVLNALNKESGLLGVSGLSNDVRDIMKAVAEGNDQARLAADMLAYKVKKYIGSYAAVMNGVDAIAFSAGTGENRDDVRKMIMTNMEYLGVEFDEEANKNFVRGENWCITKPTSKVAVWIIPTNEELSIARQTKEIVSK